MMLTDMATDGREQRPADGAAAVPTGGTRREEGEPADLERTPGLLRHLRRLTGAFVCNGGRVPYIHLYSRMEGEPQDAEPTGRLAPALQCFVAQDSGLEGIACVDDVARAVVLALQVHELSGSGQALALARDWLGFLRYMQLPDHRLVNFIKDLAGTRNVNGRTSYPGGEPWTVRALMAYATGFRVLHDEDCRRRFGSTLFPPTQQLALVANFMLAVMDVYESQPDHGYERWIEDMGAMLMAGGPDYLRAACGRADVPLADYHQLQALSRAGRLLSNRDYLAHCEATVDHLIEPVVRAGFYHVWPDDRDHQSVFDISAIALGLEELHYATQKARYRDLALRCADWLDGNNPAGRAVYDPRTGRCHDNINLQGRIAPTTGAESAIEAGFLHLVRCRLTGRRDGLEEGTGDVAPAVA